MLASITPLGERGRHMRWGTTVSLYLVGSLIGGATLGGVAAMAGLALSQVVSPSTTVLLAVLTICAAVAVALDGNALTMRAPSVRRQVNENWLTTYRSWVYGLGFGFQLGLGVVTQVTTAAVYLVVAMAFLAHSLLLGYAIGATFGVARAFPVLLARRVTTFELLRRFHRHVAHWDSRARLAVIGAETSSFLFTVGLLWRRL